MRSQQLNLFLFGLIALFGVTVNLPALAKGEVHVFNRPVVSDAVTDRPAYKRIGDLSLKNGVSVPAYNLTLASGRAESEFETTSTNDFSSGFSVESKIASQLVAFLLPHGWVLVPKNWKPLKGMLAGIGSTAVLFGSDKNAQSYLSYFEAGSCVGCIETDASLFFDKARKRAQANEFTYYTKSNAPLKLVSLNKTQKAYRLRLDNGNPIDGLVTYDGEGDEFYSHMQVSVPEKDRALASILLNQFVWHRSIK